MATDPPLTKAQRAYLDAFDLLLLGVPGSRDLMGQRFTRVVDEAGGLKPNGKPRRGPVFRVPSERWQ